MISNIQYDDWLNEWVNFDDRLKKNFDKVLIELLEMGTCSKIFHRMRLN